MDGNYNQPNRLVRQPIIGETGFLLLLVGGGAFFILIYIASARLHFTMRQIQEVAAYVLLTLGCCYLSIWQVATLRRRRTDTWPPIRLSRERDRKNVAKAWAQDAVVLGYDANGNPWIWPDRV